MGAVALAWLRERKAGAGHTVGVRVLQVAFYIVWGGGGDKGWVGGV